MPSMCQHVCLVGKMVMRLLNENKKKPLFRYLSQKTQNVDLPTSRSLSRILKKQAITMKLTKKKLENRPTKAVGRSDRLKTYFMFRVELYSVEMFA